MVVRRNTSVSDSVFSVVERFCLFGQHVAREESAREP